MSWYMAVFVRGARVGGKVDEERPGDMLYTLVEATDADGAYARALELGRDATDTYTDEDGTQVSLEVIGLADLAEIDSDELRHGVDVYSQILPATPSEMVAPKEELAVFSGDGASDDE